jgi:tetratricopeptide (TPR) repeat protein
VQNRKFWLDVSIGLFMNHPMGNNLDEKRIAQIRRELENYSTELLTEIWRRHNLDEWTEEAFVAIRQILATRPAINVPEQADIVLSGTHLERAYQYGEAGRLQDALSEVDLAIQQDPDSLEAHQYRGNLLEDLGDLDGAIKSYRKARYLDRSNESTRTDLRRALTKQFQQVAAKRQPAEDAEYLDEEEPEETEAEESEELDENGEEEDGAGEETEEEGADDEEVATVQSEPTEPLSISTLILIGLATGWVSIAFIVVGLIVYSHLQSFLAGASGNLLQFASPSDKNILIISGVLWLGLLVFYMRHLFNKEDMRISLFGLIGASLIFLPFISMPVYFYKYVWQPNLDNPE